MASFNIVDGIEKIYYAVLNEKNEQYGEVKLFSDMVVEFGMSPTQNSTSVYGSNREITSILGNLTGEVTLTVQSLDEEVQAEVMGKVKAEGGGYLDKGLDKPYVALMAEKSLDGGEYEYLTLYKGKFDLAEEKAKTKEMANILAKLNIADKKVLVVIETIDEKLYLAARNIANIKVVLPSEVNTLDVMTADVMLFDEKALEKVEEVLGNE